MCQRAPIALIRFVPALFLFLVSGSAGSATQFSFTLDNTYLTSAAVYKHDSTLVKTLWRRASYGAGPHSATWDGTDDAGRVVPQGSYQIRLVYHNVKYLWDGVVGNTSRANTGSTVYRSFLPIFKMAITGKTAFFSVGYNEGQCGMHRFATDTPQVQTPLAHHDAFTAFGPLATDGVNAYWADIGGITDTKRFIAATRVSDNTLVTFQNGADLCLNYFAGGPDCYPDQHWQSCIDTLTTTKGFGSVTGLAVQKTAPYLFVAHGELDKIHILDKTTGAMVTTYGLPNPRDLACDNHDDVWVLCTSNNQNVIQKFAVSPNGTLSLQRTLSSCVSPLALAVSADGQTLLAADGASSQQVKAFNPADGTALWTLGLPAGNYAGSDITNDRFFFGNSTYLAFQPDGSFWVGDTKNQRNLHFTSTRQLVDCIMYLPHSYCSAVDINDSRRVFSDFKEFTVDYEKPLQGMNGSWTYQKNFLGVLPPEIDSTGFSAGLVPVYTLGNGRTYAVTNNATKSKREIVELTASGQVRQTGVFLDPNVTWYANGDLRRCDVATNVQTIYQRGLIGFDANNTPVFSVESRLASVPAEPGDPYYRPGAFPGFFGPAFPMTSTGVIVSFDNSVGGRSKGGMHLGGFKAGATQWLWKASPTGDIDTLGTYDTGNGVNYGGNIAMTNGRNIIYGYHGEFWKSTQASQWMHFYDNGLFIGQFGTLGSQVGDTVTDGFAGNSFSPSLVEANGRLYLWCNDESNHAGVCRWRIDGTENIHEMAGNGALGGSIVLEPVATSVDLEKPPRRRTAISVMRRGARLLFVSQTASRLVLRVFSIDGRTVFMRESARGVSGSFDLSGLRGGSYIYRIDGPSGFVDERVLLIFGRRQDSPGK